MSTIEDVARHAGVSTSTVSRALARPDMVAADTRRRVLTATEELGYLHNPSARALATGRSGLIGLVVPTLANPFFAPIIAGAQAAAEEAGNELLIVVSNGQPSRERTLLNRFRDRVDGMVAVAPRGRAQDYVAQSRSQPVVTINRRISGVSSVLIDTPTGLGQLGQHLASLGHRRVAYLGGPPGSWMDGKRQRALTAALSAVDGEVVPLAPIEPTFAAGSAHAAEVTAQRCSAVVAYNSVLALGLLQQLLTTGTRVPQQLSLACADDLTGVGLAAPDITALHVPAQDAGSTAVRTIIEHLMTPPDPDARTGFPETQRKLPVSLVEGNSTAALAV